MDKVHYTYKNLMVVDDYETELYYHQYMQNVSAAKTEGETVKSNLSKNGIC